MRQLLPVPADIDPAVEHAAAARPAPDGRPWVALNMVASVDGATAVAGVSGGLGGPADKEVFRALRAIADVIVVAAGTVRAERYGPPRTTPEHQAARVARGQTPFPRLAIVSGSLDLDATSSVFTEAPEPPLVLTGDHPPDDRVHALDAVAEVVRLGPSGVSMTDALAAIGALGHRVVLCEGGPSLNGQLLAAGLVDEINLTVSPMLVGGDSLRVAVGPDGLPTTLELAHLWVDGSVLLARYVRT